MKKKTERKKLESKLEKLITDKLRNKYGNVCQLSGKSLKKPENENGKQKGLGQFHILSKGAYPNMKYRPENILWVAWYPYHYWWHHDYWKARDIVLPMLKNKLGDNFEDRLKKLSLSLPKTTIFELEKLYEWWGKYE